MAQVIKLKRSAAPGKQPTVDDLALGELAINTFDGTLYTKINDGFDSIKKLSPEPVLPYTPGTGISIVNRVISSTVKSAGTVIEVQIGDGQGNFSSVPQQPAGRVLTSNGDQPPTWEPVPVSGGTVRNINASGGATGLTFSGGPVTEEGVLTMGGTLAISNGGTGATTVAGAQSNLLPTQTGNAGRALYTDGAGTLSWEISPGSTYTPGIGLGLNGTEFFSTVADNTGESNRVTISNGNGTLSNLPAGAAGTVLRSSGSGLAPVWSPIGSGTVTSVSAESDVDGLTFAGNPVTASGVLTLSGVVAITSGGTGGTDARSARTNLLPSQVGQPPTGYFLTTNGTDVSWATPLPPQSSQTGKFLTTNGTTASWQNPPGSGTVTSINISGGTTGLNTTGGPVTETGTITLGGTLSVSNGGTGVTTVAEIQTVALPTQTNMSGRTLATNGTTAFWSDTIGQGTVTSVALSGGGTGLTSVGGAVTGSGTLTIGGKLNIASGGTGGSTPVEARTNLLPDQSNNAGTVLATNGTDVYWSYNTGITSVDISPGTTGLTATGGPITSAGSITLGGTLNIANGGTGATTASAAINALVPNQTGQTGRFLMTNGTMVGWSSAGQGSVTSVDIDGGTTGLTATGGPITSSGILTLGGRLALANGGTGATSAQQARNNILPEQDTHAGQVLVTDGTNVSWSDTVGRGTVTSVAISGGTTGLTATGGPITSSGILTLGGTLAIANGGTGQTTATAAINALVPSQTSMSGRFLTTNGTSVSWGTAAGGANTQVLYNNSGAITGTAGFTFTSGTNTLAVPSLTTTTTVDMSGSVMSTARVVSASSVDCSTGVYFTKAAPTGALTWTFDNVPASGKAYIFALALTNGGQFAQTWPTSVVWPSGAAPTLSTGATIVDLLIFSTSDGGTTWRGSSLLNYSK